MLLLCLQRVDGSQKAGLNPKEQKQSTPVDQLHQDLLINYWWTATTCGRLVQYYKCYEIRKAEFHLLFVHAAHYQSLRSSDKHQVLFF